MAEWLVITLLVVNIIFLILSFIYQNKKLFKKAWEEWTNSELNQKDVEVAKEILGELKGLIEEIMEVVKKEKE